MNRILSTAMEFPRASHAGWRSSDLILGGSRLAADMRVLVVDDEESIRLSLARTLRGKGYAVQGAGSAEAALAALVRDDFALMLCDMRMPGMDGLELLRRAMGLAPHLAVVMLSGLDDVLTARAAFMGGAADYLSKPVSIDVLGSALEDALRRRALLIEQQWIDEEGRDQDVGPVAGSVRKRRALSELSATMAESLVNALEAKDRYLRGHSQRVAELAGAIAVELALDGDAVEAVQLAGWLHDVGKIGLREEVLNKPGALTADEYEHVKQHVRIGMEILAPLRHLGSVLEFVHDHHERWDGAGYPRGRRGAEITLGGRIVAASDVFDAITSKRAYRDAMSAERALDYLESTGMVGTQLDARVYDTLRTIVLHRRTPALVGVAGE